MVEFRADEHAGVWPSDLCVAVADGMEGAEDDSSHLHADHPHCRGKSLTLLRVLNDVTLAEN